MSEGYEVPLSYRGDRLCVIHIILIIIVLNVMISVVIITICIVEIIISGGNNLFEIVAIRTDIAGGRIITLLLLVLYTSTETCFLVTNQVLRTTAVLVWGAV